MIRAPLEIYANRSGMGLAGKICDELTKINAANVAAGAPDACVGGLKAAMVRPGKDIFACGEFQVALEDSVRGKDVFLVQCAIDKSTPGRSIHDNIWETLQTIEALNGCHAGHLNVIMPCLPYSRQHKTDGRVSYGAVVMAKVLAAVGTGQLITFDLHAQEIKGFYRALDVKPDGLFATNIFLDHIRSNYNLDELMVAAPDEGGGKRAKYYADSLFGEENVDETNITNSIKYRSKKIANKIDSLKILGNVSGKIVIVADDLLDTAGTMEAFVEAAFLQGAKGTVICGTHAILSDPASKRLDRLYSEGKLREVLTTDTVPQPADYALKHSWFRQSSVAPMLAKMVYKYKPRKKRPARYISER